MEGVIANVRAILNANWWHRFISESNLPEDKLGALEVGNLSRRHNTNC